MGGAVDAFGCAADQAIGQDRLSDVVGNRGLYSDVRRRQHCGETEQSAAVPVMGVATGLAVVTGPALSVAAIALDGSARRLVQVMMHSSVRMHVHGRSSDLRSNFIEAVGRGRPAPERERKRRHDDARKVNQRGQGRSAPSRQAGQNSKHRVTALDHPAYSHTRTT
jgi:hypothetical protein